MCGRFWSWIRRARVGGSMCMLECPGVGGGVRRRVAIVVELGGCVSYSDLLFVGRSV